MDKELINLVKQKKEFSELPDSIVILALEKSKSDVKKAREILRKYFGVFLTNKVIKGMGEEVLSSHISTRNRDYKGLYAKILNGDEKTILDLGCGVNGFSYKFFGLDVAYIGFEASGQVVRNTNNYFKDRGFEKAHVFHKDLFDKSFILDIIKQVPEPRTLFLFNVVDALEFFKRDYSKDLLLGLKGVIGVDDRLVLSFPIQSLSGKTVFKVERKWLLDFVNDNFQTVEEFVMSYERFLIIKNKK